VISGVGTGGTITGVGQVLKPRKPSLKMIAVEPEDSPGAVGRPAGPHKIQGIGAGFVPRHPRPQGDRRDHHHLKRDRAGNRARAGAQAEGIPVGISSGAAIAAALKIGKRPENAGKTIVAIMPSFAERYLSTALFDTASRVGMRSPSAAASLGWARA
jgi:cysteine synthase A